MERGNRCSKCFISASNWLYCKWDDFLLSSLNFVYYCTVTFSKRISRWEGCTAFKAVIMLCLIFGTCVKVIEVLKYRTRYLVLFLNNRDLTAHTSHFRSGKITVNNSGFWVKIFFHSSIVYCSSPTMNVATSSSGCRIVATSDDHPQLTKNDARHIHTLTQDYYQYTRGVNDSNKWSDGISRQLKWRIQSSWSSLSAHNGESLSSISVISKTSILMMTLVINNSLGTRSEAFQNVVTIDALEKFVETNLRIDMTDADARHSLKKLFVPYKSLHILPILAWLTKNNKKKTPSQVLSAIRSESAQSRLGSNFKLSHCELRKIFRHSCRVP